LFKLTLRRPFLFCTLGIAASDAQVAMKWIMLPSLLVAASLQRGAARELTSENWDKETAGKQVFVKFQAPW